MTYKVQLPVFEGPLDLLLHLIKKEELDIYDIPISKITDQYLEYLKVLEMLDLEIAGEFILMAATLMHIKTKMLLPVDETEEKALEEADPREELVKKLLEYKTFKEAAGELKEMHLRQKDIFTRSPGIQNTRLQAKEEEDGFEASLFDLITAFTKVLKEIPRTTFHQVIKDEFTVSDKIHDILHALVAKPAILFHDLFKGVKNKGEIVAIFLALLELVKLKEVLVKQSGPFKEIEVIRNSQWQTK